MLTRIVGLERRLMPIGKIRLGDQIDSSNGRKRPHVLEKVRLTSSNGFLLQEAAKLYGGVPRPWEDAPAGPRQWELYVEADAIPILIPPIDALMQCYECWSAKGCLRRCNNETIQYAYDPKEVGKPCICPADPEARQALAAEGKACKLTTRISCMLPDLPGIGIWVIETHSYYASLWTAGMVEMLETMAKQGRICEAMLRIERQSRKGKHGVRHFAIPTIMPHIMTPRQLFASEMRASLGLREAEAEQKLPIPLEAPALLDRAATATDELFGDGASANMRATAPVQSLPPILDRVPRQYTVTAHGTTRTHTGHTLPQEDGALAIEDQITDLLYAQGRDDAGVAAWWQEQRATHADLSPGYLNFCLEQLQATPPRQTDDARSNDALPGAWRALARAQDDLAWTESEKRTWERKQARRFRTTYSELPLGTVQGLIDELEALYAMQAPAASLEPEPISAFSLPEEEDEETASPGLEQDVEPLKFDTLRDELNWWAQSLQDLMLKEEVHALVEDPDTSDEVLLAKRAVVQKRLQEESGGLPF